jgi:hypothetical protein
MPFSAGSSTLLLSRLSAWIPTHARSQSKLLYKPYRTLTSALQVLDERSTSLISRCGPLNEATTAQIHRRRWSDWKPKQMTMLDFQGPATSAMSVEQRADLDTSALWLPIWVCLFWPGPTG